jgi:CheY-like chemotaxis protein
VSLAFHAEPDLPLIAGDPDRLQQIIWNLLSNAVKFTPKEGQVEIALRLAGAHVEIAVTDSGAGIEPAFLPFVFDRFRQADSSPARRHGGLGLGLAIVRHLVELHGGAVRAESDGKGLGARFIVALPVPSVLPRQPKAATSADVGEAFAATEELGVSLAGLRVLAIDDDPDAREVVQAVLLSLGATVRIVSSAEELIRILDDFRPDVLVSDIGMPGEDGFAMLRRVRALPSPSARVPAIAFTAYAGEAEAKKAMRAGFLTHLAKPIDPQLLALAIANAVGRFTT